MVVCYDDLSEVATAGPFDFWGSSARDIATLLCEPDILELAIKGGHVVFSYHGRDVVTGRKVDHGSEDDPGTWHRVEAVRSCLRTSPRWQPTKFHCPRPDDVLLGAEALALKPDRFAAWEVGDVSTPWEWRLFVNGFWRRLPTYVAGVFEGALQNGERSAMVQSVFDYDGVYIVADLEGFCVNIGEPVVRRPGRGQAFNKGDFIFGREWVAMTRFLRGRPSTEPDRRKSAHTEDGFDVVEEVLDRDAINVRSLSGDLVFSMACAEARSLMVADVLQSVSTTLGKPSKQLCLMLDERMLEPSETLGSLLLHGGGVEVLALVNETKVLDTPFAEWIPECLPGDLSFFAA